MVALNLFLAQLNSPFFNQSLGLRRRPNESTDEEGDRDLDLDLDPLGLDTDLDRDLDE